MTGVQLLELTTFTFVLWLGCYLIARDYRKPLTRYAGLGSIAYAVVLAVSFLSTLPDSPSYFVKLSWSILFFPPFFWSSAITHLENERSDDSPEELPARNSVALMGTLSVSIALFLLPILWENDLGRPSTLGLALLSIWLAAPLINTARTLIRISKSNTTALVGIRAVLISTVFFTLGSGFVLFPLKIIPAEWVLLAIALDFELLGLAVAWLDAFRLGERLIPDFSRSLIVSIFLSALFGVQLIFVIELSTGPTFLMLFVLHLTVIASIFVSVFVDDIQAFVESKLVSSRLDHNNLDLRAAARAQLRLQAQAGVAPYDDEAFYRHTRRALSDFGNLPKLISNPLMNLPFVSSAITETRSADNPLERAKILKAAVKDAVLRLKPESDKMFDETDEWRFFNALYYPYVIGLRPYSHKLRLDDLNSDSKLALEWFQTSVPERTLYNWQKSAAMLVAQQLRENTPDETF